MRRVGLGTPLPKHRDKPVHYLQTLVHAAVQALTPALAWQT